MRSVVFVVRFGTFKNNNNKKVSTCRQTKVVRSKWRVFFKRKNHRTQQWTTMTFGCFGHSVIRMSSQFNSSRFASDFYHFLMQTLQCLTLHIILSWLMIKLEKWHNQDFTFHIKCDGRTGFAYINAMMNDF